MNPKWSSRLNVAVNTAVLAVMIVVLLHPRGPLIPKLDEWKRAYSVRGELTDTWPQLIATPSRGTEQQSADSKSRVLVVFSDYQCPACKYVAERLPQMMEQNEFSVIVRHLPLTRIHPKAEEAARASICAERQDKFDEMHAFLFTTSEWSREADWLDIANRIGVPRPDEFVLCMPHELTTRRLNEDISFAQRLGLSATPSFVGPGRVHEGIPDDKDLSRLLGG